MKSLPALPPQRCQKMWSLSMQTHAKWMTLALVGSSALWELYLALRQNRALRTAPKSVPKAMKSCWTQEQYDFSNKYSLERSTFAIVRHAISTALNVGFVAGNVFARMWYATLYPWGGGLEGGLCHLACFVCSFDVLSATLDLPLDLYETFHIEEKYGFNKQTMRLFAVDWLKQRGLNAVLSLPLAGGISWILDRFQDQFPLYLFSFLTGWIVLMSVLYPTLIQPLFNKYTTLDDSPLRHKIEALAASLKFPLKKLYVVDGSRRSAHSNAYLYGFFKNKRIVLYDTLLSQMEPHHDRILAVLAHELGHWKCHHAVKQMAVGIVRLFGVCYGARYILVAKCIYAQLGFSTQPAFIGLMLYLSIYLAPLDAVLQAMTCWLTRRYEYEADRFAVGLQYGTELKEGLICMSEKNASSIIFDPLYAACKFTHPPILLRLEALETAMQKTQ